MAAVHVISVKLVDYLGGSKTIPYLYLPATTTIATINSVLATMLPKLDAVIDPKIYSAAVLFNLTLPGGLKADAVTGKDVHNGANLTYDPNGTDYAFSIYIPGWEEAGFAGQAVLETGDYDDFEQELITDNFTDRDGNDFASFTTGYRTRRK